jgi:nucleotide-binding universal stress UspA family protein
MKTGSVRAWCRPRKILIVSDMSEHPARTLEAITKFQGTGARVFLAPLQKPRYEVGIAGRSLSHLALNDKKAEEPSLENPHQHLWSEILRETTVLNSARLLQVPELAESVGADIVILVAPDGGFTQLNTVPFEIGLLGSLEVPILIFGKHMDLSSWKHNDFYRILLPVTFGPGLLYRLRFACRLACRYHARLTVLHIFESHMSTERQWERTPVAVESKLPISQLRREGMLCPMEITVCEGYAERAILRFSELRHHDLIIMGGPRQDTLHGQFGQSAVQGVIADAHCPVLVLGSAIEAGCASIDSVSQLAFA